MPSREERGLILQRMLDRGVPEEQIAEALVELKTPQSKEEFFSRAAKSLGLAYGAPPVQSGPPTSSPGMELSPDNPADRKMGKFESFAKGAVDQLPAAMGAAGGLLGGSAVGTATLGLGAIPAAVVSAGVAGSAGAVAKDALNRIFWPEQAAKTFTEGAANTISGVQQGVMGEMGGAVVAKVGGIAVNRALNMAKEGLESIAGWAAKKSIPGLTKFADKLGGEKGVQKLVQVATDEGVFNTPATLERLNGKLDTAREVVGARLGKTWKEVDNVTEAAVRAKDIKASAYEKWVDFIKETKGTEPTEAMQSSFRRALNNVLKDDNRLLGHAEINAKARMLEGTMYNQLRPDYSTAARQAAISLRKANLSMLSENAPKELVEQLVETSSAYNKLRVAVDATEDGLSKNPSIMENVWGWSRAAVLATKGGPAGVVAEGAIRAGKTTTAKTALAASANLGKRILENGAKMDGGWGKVMSRIVTNKGYEGLVEWHAHRMMENDKYREAYLALNTPTPEPTPLEPPR